MLHHELCLLHMWEYHLMCTLFMSISALETWMGGTA